MDINPGAVLALLLAAVMANSAVRPDASVQSLDIRQRSSRDHLQEHLPC